MIGYLKGRVHRGTVLTDAGVGYVVHTPEPLVEGAEVELDVTTIVREGAIDLYGFADADDQALFAALTKITGVGPSSALALLRDVGVAGIVAAVGSSDHKALTKAAGVGPKLANTIIAMIKLPAEVAARAAALPAPAPRSELGAALEALGYSPDAAAAAAAAALEAHPDGGDETLLAAALAELRSAA